MDEKAAKKAAKEEKRRLKEEKKAKRASLAATEEGGSDEVRLRILQTIDSSLKKFGSITRRHLRRKKRKRN